MSKENKQEMRFYVLIFMSFILLVMGFWAYPPGLIESSVLVAAGCLMGMGGLCVGIDIQSIIRELRLLKRDSVNQLTNDKQTQQTNNE